MFILKYNFIRTCPSAHSNIFQFDAFLTEMELQNVAATICLWRAIVLGTYCLGGPNELGPIVFGAQMSIGTK